MSAALVTGSAGFVGRHMVSALEAAGYDVWRCDPAHGGRMDCRDTFRTARDGRCHYDLVVHCAAMVDGREAIDGRPALLGAYNLQLDGALFEWALRARPGRVVYLSSSAAYPVSAQLAQGSQPLAEDLVGRCPADPDQTYGWVKLTGELLAAETRKTGVPVTVVRPFSGYGSDQDERYPFPAMIARAARHETPFEVWGDGRQVRDFVHVEDVAAAVLALVDAGVDGPVNLATGRATSMDQLAEMAMLAAGYRAPIRHLPAKPSGVARRVADVTLMRRHYEPRVTLEEGVARATAEASGARPA